MTVAIDFDGVIHRYSQGWRKGGVIYDPPMPGAPESIREIMSQEGVVVFTARDDLAAVAAWLGEQGVPAITHDEWNAERGVDTYDQVFWNDLDRVLVTNRKPAARVYLDDRAVKFTPEAGWEQALADMGFREPDLTLEQKIRALHRRNIDGECGHCSGPLDYMNPRAGVPYPCDTIELLG